MARLVPLLLLVLTIGVFLGAGSGSVSSSVSSSSSVAASGSVAVSAAAEGPIPLLDGSTFDPAEWAALSGATQDHLHAALPPGVDTYRVVLAADGTVTIGPGPTPSGMPDTSDGRLPLPGDTIALCTPHSLGLHYTTTLDQQETCPFTWHDGPIDETFLVCAVAGDCTIAGQDAPTRGSFWVICHGASGSAQAWGVLPAASVQCQAGTIGARPHAWTHWNSWCRVFGVADGAALCGHAYSSTA